MAWTNPVRYESWFLVDAWMMPARRLWMTRASQQAFRYLFDGRVEQYDPWDAAYRTDGPQYPGTTMCSVFRTFQGWTALSDMDHDQGVLHTVPIPGAMAYLLLPGRPGPGPVQAGRGRQRGPEPDANGPAGPGMIPVGRRVEVVNTTYRVSS